MKFVNLLLLIVAFSCAADGTLTSLKVDSDVVYFSTNETKANSSPGCMVADNGEQWSVSLNSETGRAIYGLLVTATAVNRNITVQSANDCADVEGFERAQSITLGIVANTATGSGQFYLYQGDGTTKLGPVAKFIDEDSFYYLASANDRSLKLLDNPSYDQSNNTIYFDKDNCQGTAWASSPGWFFVWKSFNDGKFARSSTTYTNQYANTRLSSNGHCAFVYGMTRRYSLDLNALHPVCGEAPCQIREE